MIKHVYKKLFSCPGMHVVLGLNYYTSLKPSFQHWEIIRKIKLILLWHTKQVFLNTLMIMNIQSLRNYHRTRKAKAMWLLNYILSFGAWHWMTLSVYISLSMVSDNKRTLMKTNELWMKSWIWLIAMFQSYFLGSNKWTVVI